jgi:kumamolisin
MPAFTVLKGSRPAFDSGRAAIRRHRSVGALHDAERAAEAEVTVVLRENPLGPSIDERLSTLAAQPLRDRRHLTSWELNSRHGASDPDWRKVSAWARGKGLRVVSDRSDQAGRRLRLRGSINDLDTAFGTKSRRFRWTRPLDGRTVEYRASLRAPVLPTDVADAVIAVQGINEVPFLPRYRMLAPGSAHNQVYNPEELAHLYNFPALPNGGAGQTLNVGIAELGGAVNPKVAAWFFKQQQYANVTMSEFGVNGAGPAPDPQGADIEVALDWQVVLRALVASAPQAKINILVSYGTNSDQGFADAWNVFVTGKGVTSVKTYSAAHPSGVSAGVRSIDPTTVVGVSTSWGQNESGWAPASIAAMDQVAGAGALRGVFFANASGDNGAADSRADGLVDADAPSLAGNVLAVGGTQLNSVNGVVTSEPVWDDAATSRGAAGGGVARTVGVPDYQRAAGISIAAVDDGHTGRVDPDLALNADPLTAYNVVTDVTAQQQPVITPVGGTSASTPLATAGFTLVSALAGKKLGRVQDTLYALGKAGIGIRDVTEGGNAYPAGTPGYTAGPGFDAASGWGSADFSALAQAWLSTVPLPVPGAPAPAPPTASPSSRFGELS